MDLPRAAPTLPERETSMKRPLPMDEILWHADVAESARTGKTVCEIQAARRAQGADRSEPGSEERHPITDHVSGLPLKACGRHPAIHAGR